MASRTKSRPLPVEPFDADTPPPRRRPQGVPVARWVELPPGESALGHFRSWDNQGRIPEGCVLLEFVGTGCGRAGHSGYVVVCNPEVGAAVTRPLGAGVGEPVGEDAMGGWRTVTTVIELPRTGRPLVVLAPPEPGRAKG